MNEQIDNYIRDKVAPEFAPLIQAFRDLVKNKFPDLTEGMRGGTELYPGTPTYRFKRIIVVVNPTPKFVTFAFTDGKAINDKYNMLEGVGNKSSNIRLKSLDQFDPQIMAYYLQQAIEIDSAK